MSGFARLSAAGRGDLSIERFEVAVVADAAACPDVDVLAAGMSRAWRALTAGAEAA